MPRSFKLVQSLGEGSFGAVHLAEIASEAGFVQRLAVKWLHPEWSHDAEVARRLRDEARLLALLNHDHIVRVHGLTRFDGRLAILMEPVEGADLSRLSGALPPRGAMEIVSAVADALDAAWHATVPGSTDPLHVVHRDIKPSNIMVTARGGVKVMDFGIARATFEAREAQTRSQQFGTARYMAPERWLDGVAESPSDIFSLGVTLIELLGGEPVERFRLSAEGFGEDLRRALGRLDGWPDVKTLSERMCAFHPEKRPTGAEVAQQCRALAQALPPPTLREWAERWVPSAATAPRAQAAATYVEEDTSADTFEQAAVSAPTTPLPLASAPIDRAEPARPWTWGHVVLVVAMTALGMTGWQLLLADQTAESVPAADPVTVDALGEPEPAASDPATPPVEPLPVPEQAALAPEPAPLAPESVVAKVSPKAHARPISAIPKTAAVPSPDDIVVLTFIFEPPYEVELDPGGPARSRHGVAFERGKAIAIHTVGNGREFTCTVTADPTRRTVRIDGDHQACSTR